MAFCMPYEMTTNKQSGRFIEMSRKNVSSSTSTLTHITDDILQALDNSEYSALIILDFSKTFDTVRHVINDNEINWIVRGSSSTLSHFRTGQRASNWEMSWRRQDMFHQECPQAPFQVHYFLLSSRQFHEFIMYCKIHMCDDIRIYYSFI